MEVLSAISPIIAQRVATTIQKAIAGTRVVRVGGGGEALSPNKRPRLDE
jgi:hypothetical protein